MAQNPKHDNKHIVPAIAPYNFVSLPEKTLPLVTQENLRAVDRDQKMNEALPDHDSFLPNRKSGYFDVELETLSPLYIRAGFSVDEFRKMEKEKNEPPADFRNAVKNKPDFFYINEKGRPVIPGSSIRGMLRNLVSVITYSKLSGVTQKRMFYRNIGNEFYRYRMIQRNTPKMEGGFWKQNEDGSAVIKSCYVFRIKEELLVKYLKTKNEIKDDLYTKDETKNPPEVGPNDHPNPEFQHRKVYIKKAVIDLTKNFKLIDGIRTDTPTENYPDEAILVITGPIDNKKTAYLFVEKEKKDEICVSPNMVKAFHDEDQMTPWQKDAFPDGKIQTGDPIFYLRNGENLDFFGRAKMFRLPYKKNAFDCIPENLRKPGEIDRTEAMFGFSRSTDEINKMKADKIDTRKQGEKARSYAGRISVTDAIFTGSKPSWLTNSSHPSEPIIPRILSSPKPTSTNLYLEQEGIIDAAIANHYDSPRARLRGHKFYWHQGNRNSKELETPVPDEGSENPLIEKNGHIKGTSTQHTQFNPLKFGNLFTFRVYFENLSPEELGALAWALQLKNKDNFKYAHSLGMGKPLGMGAVKLTPALHMINRSKRYKTLFSKNGWNLEDSQESIDGYINQFETDMNQKLGHNGQFSSINRISELLCLLEWSDPVINPESKQYFSGFSQEGTLPKALEVNQSQYNVGNQIGQQSELEQTNQGPLAIGSIEYMKLIDIGKNKEFILKHKEMKITDYAYIPQEKIISKERRVGEKATRIRVRIIEIKKIGDKTEYKCEETTKTE
jgi:CRISPR-associated protein (TIGR03986 family)